MFLTQAAWANARGADRPTAVDDAAKRVRRYLSDDAAGEWQPGGGDLGLVRARLEPATEVPGQAGAFTVHARLEPVGVLNAVGAVDPPASAAPYDFAFQVVSIGGGRLRLAKVPPGLLFNVDELSTWYEPRMIYFWSDTGAQRVLVPDPRYMAKVIDVGKRPGEVFNWLSQGPSGLLKPVVQAVPATIRLKDRLIPPGPGQPLTINLSPEAAGPAAQQQLQDLATQVRWSLHPSTTPVQVLVAEQRQDIDGSSPTYLRSNAAAWPESIIEPDKFCVLDGRARAVNASSTAGSRLLGDDDANRDVVSAAVTGFGDDAAAALVRAEPEGQRLWIASMSGTGDARSRSYRRTEVVGRALSRPAWVARGDRRVLLPVDGRLRTVSMDGTWRPVAMVPADLGLVSAVSVAPDGRRVALIAGGQVYVASARFDGDVLTVGETYRRLGTGLTKALGVGWTREDRLLVGGSADRGSPMVQVSVDSTTHAPVERANLASLNITQLVAYPDDPVRGGDRILAMFEANGQAYDVYGQGVSPVIMTGPAVGPSPSAATPATVLRAPFFRE